jgi:hypothetical protein
VLKSIPSEAIVDNAVRYFSECFETRLAIRKGKICIGFIYSDDPGKIFFEALTVNRVFVAGQIPLATMRVKLCLKSQDSSFD